MVELILFAFIASLCYAFAIGMEMLHNRKERKKTEMGNSIDYVFSYIDYTQEEVRKLYKDVTGEDFTGYANRTYIDAGLLVRLIRKNMPFVRNVYVICKDVQKLPDSLENVILESNGRVVRVNESEILPMWFHTFSSACIEMFIWRIKGLADRFIYGNDDMIPLKPMKESDFFINGKPTIFATKKAVEVNNLYNLHIMNATNVIFDRHKNNDDYKVCCNVAHTFRPLTMEICEKCFNEYRRWIMQSLTTVRYYNNFNADIFVMYGLKNNLIINNRLSYQFYFTSLSDKLYVLNKFQNDVTNGRFQSIPTVACFNDNIKTQNGVNYAKEKISYIMEKMLLYTPECYYIPDSGSTMVSCSCTTSDTTCTLECKCASGTTVCSGCTFEVNQTLDK